MMRNQNKNYVQSKDRAILFNCVAASKLAAVAMAFAYLSVPTRADLPEKERAAIARVEALGGKTVANDADGRVRSVILLEKRPALTDEAIESIDFAAFSKLQYLIVSAQQISDNSLEHMGKAPSQLSSLFLVGTKITDMGLVRFLRRQKSLYDLCLDGVPVTDAVMREIGAMDNLRMLTLNRMKITDQGLAKLCRLEGLVFLDVSDTDVGDPGLAELAKMANLNTVRLGGTKITDMGILHLGANTTLRTLEIRETKVTEGGKEALQKLLPNLKIVR